MPGSAAPWTREACESSPEPASRCAEGWANQGYSLRAEPWVPIDLPMTLCLRDAVTDTSRGSSGQVDLAAQRAPLPKRVGEWFWRGRSLAAQRAALPVRSARAPAFAQRAKCSAEIARLALTPPEPLELSGEPFACELYRQSVYWAAAALAGVTEPDQLQAGSFDTVRVGLDEVALRRVGKDEAGTARLQESLDRGSFIYFAELPRELQKSTCSAMRRLSEAMIERLDAPALAVRRIRNQRIWRIAALAVLILAGVFGVRQWLAQRAQKNDLTFGHPWAASSAYETGGCTSPEQECAESPGYFFHTAEQRNPWIQFDLEGLRSISAVQIENRRDCCTERAVPMIVEVSSDGKHWQTMARQETVFTDWKATFSPIEARYVRLRVLTTGYLHLARVRVLP